MSDTYNIYEATGGQTDFVVSFPYINRSHVSVTVNGASANILSWPNSSTLRLAFGATSGSIVLIERNTPITDQLVKFNDGAVLTADDLNLAVKQTLYHQQELASQYKRQVEAAVIRLATEGGIGVVDGEDVLNAIAARLAQETTINTFLQRVSDIDLNASEILTQAQTLIDQASDITQLDARAAQIAADLLSSTEALTADLTSARTDLLADLTSTATGLQASIDANKAELDTEAAALRADLVTLTSLVDTLTGGDAGTGVATLIQNEETARIAGDNALVNTVSLLGAKSGDGLTFIADLNTLKVSPTESFAQRFTAISADTATNSAAIATEIAARTDAITAEAARIDLLDAAVGGVAADLVTESATRATEIAAEATARQAGEASLIGQFNAAFLSEQTARINADDALAVSITGLTADVAGNVANLNTESAARAAADTTLATDITALTTRVGDAEAAIVTESTARSTNEAAVATTLAGLQTSIDDVSADVVAETTARSTADAAFTQSLSAMQSQVNNVVANISQEATTRATNDSAIATDVNSLGVRMGAAEGNIVNVETAYIAADAAIVSSVSALTSRMGTAEADIVSEVTARSTADAAIVSDVSVLTTRMGAAETSILAETTARSDADAAIVTSVNSLVTRMGTAEAGITGEVTARSDADSALATDISSLQTRVNDTEADIVTLQSTAAYDDTAVVNAVTALTTRVEDNETAITDEATARSTAISAEAAARQALAAQTATDIDAAILTERGVRVTAEDAIAADVTALTSRMGTAEADILSEASTRASEIGAVATTLSGVTTAVDANTASVGILTSSVNGLEARYGVTLNVNGHITGFSQNNDGTISDFVIVADRFAFVNPDGGPDQTPSKPFEIINDQVFIKNASIQNLEVDRLGDGTLGANVTLDGNLSVGTGSIIWDNGTFMKVSGVGFGTASQFIEWFGPKMAITACSESNAITYLKTDGSAYFGGDLSAGTLKNAVQTTQTGPSASVSTGTFGSNGGTRSVTLTYSSWRSVSITSFCDGSGTPTAQVGLYRNGTLIQTLNLTGSTSCEPGYSAEEPGGWTEDMGGSLTFTDTSGGTSCEYSASILSRNLATPPSSTTGQITHRQSVGVISTE